MHYTLKDPVNFKYETKQVDHGGIEKQKHLDGTDSTGIYFFWFYGVRLLLVQCGWSKVVLFIQSVGPVWFCGGFFLTLGSFFYIYLARLQIYHNLISMSPCETHLQLNRTNWHALKFKGHLSTTSINARSSMRSWKLNDPAPPALAAVLDPYLQHARHARPIPKDGRKAHAPNLVLQLEKCQKTCSRRAQYLRNCKGVRQNPTPRIDSDNPQYW